MEKSDDNMRQLSCTKPKRTQETRAVSELDKNGNNLFFGWISIQPFLYDTR